MLVEKGGKELMAEIDGTPKQALERALRFFSTVEMLSNNHKTVFNLK